MKQAEISERPSILFLFEIYILFSNEIQYERGKAARGKSDLDWSVDVTLMCDLGSRSDGRCINLFLLA